MNRDALFYELRALAALELELDLLVAEKVGAAQREGLSWVTIAQAIGVSRPSAWRQWHAVVDDPRPTRPRRGDAGQLLLTGEAIGRGATTNRRVGSTADQSAGQSSMVGSGAGSP